MAGAVTQSRSNPLGKKVLLYSGGMDSYIISFLEDFDIILHVDMKSSYSNAERFNLNFPDNIKGQFVFGKLPLPFERKDKIVPMRNLFLVAFATNYGDKIVLGATAGDRVLDKSYEFADKSSDLLSYLYQEQHWTEKREIEVLLPYKDKTKTQLIQMYLEKGGDLKTLAERSFSCYTPDYNFNACYNCKACARKFVSLFLAGYTFDHKTKSLVKSYFKEHINNYKDRGKEWEEILEVFPTLEVKNDL